MTALVGKTAARLALLVRQAARSRVSSLGAARDAARRVEAELVADRNSRGGDDCDGQGFVVAVAFFAAAGLIMATGVLPVREAYDHVEWPILIMLGALIPVSDSLRTTGASEVIATWLSSTAATLPPWGGRADPGGDDGGDAVPQQCRDRAGDGTDRGDLRGRFRVSALSVSDGDGGRGRVRFPDAGRAPAQHAGDGAGRVRVRRLREAGRTAVAAGVAGRHPADRRGLAGALSKP